MSGSSDRMTDARTAFEDTLAQIARPTVNGGGGASVRFSIEYLKQGRICYQLRGQSRNGLSSFSGYHVDVIGGVITTLPGNTVVAAIDTFEDNAEIAFYVGERYQTGAITTELLAGLASMPEVLLAEVVTRLEHDAPPQTSLTRLALVGFEKGTAGLLSGDKPVNVCVDDLLHPFWCHGRYVFL